MGFRLVFDAEQAQAVLGLSTTVRALHGAISPEYHGWRFFFGRSECGNAQSFRAIHTSGKVVEFQLYDNAKRWRLKIADQHPHDGSGLRPLTALYQRNLKGASDELSKMAEKLLFAGFGNKLYVLDEV
jgi:hypothetical protein